MFSALFFISGKGNVCPAVGSYMVEVAVVASPTALTIAPNMTNRKTMPIREITKPAIASPLGFFVMPTAERISPITHNTHPNTGIQPSNKVTSEITKPAVPIPLDDC